MLLNSRSRQFPDGLANRTNPVYNTDGTFYATIELAQNGSAVEISGEVTLRAEGAENVLVVGAALPGAVPWREGCGEGVAVASGSRAASAILSKATAGAAA